MKHRALLLPLLLCSVIGVAHSAESNREKINKENVISFYNKALNEKDFSAARPYLGNEYKQHNPTAQDGVEGLKNFIAFMKAKSPKAHSEITKAFADGDYVVLHVKATGREPGVTRAIIDIFRLDEYHKIVEHWDVIQTVPGKSANGNGMF